MSSKSQKAGLCFKTGNSSDRLALFWHEKGIFILSYLDGKTVCVQRGVPLGDSFTVEVTHDLLICKWTNLVFCVSLAAIHNALEKNLSDVPGVKSWPLPGGYSCARFRFVPPCYGCYSTENRLIWIDLSSPKPPKVIHLYNK